jgi:hypothetical protein
VLWSRAKQKIFSWRRSRSSAFLAPDEETFANAQLWKNLLRYTCTVPLWQASTVGMK